MSMEERDVKNDEGKNKRGRTIPFIIPYRLMAASVEMPYKRSLAGIIAFSTVLKMEFKYDVPDRGTEIFRILKIMLSAFLNVFPE
ncbi:hypothetical protein SDC9_91520 [bioreactor metagenome]|uniref:Uncharacterized protein n=1 Tax=bioreactor metagenome TaxID=1076179 RepID=A0A644ZWQ1_9ZZZZ